MRKYIVFAWVNIVVGALLVPGAVAMLAGFKECTTSEDFIVAGASFGLFALLAYGLIDTGIRHLRKRSRKSARGVSAGLAFCLCMLLFSLIPESGKLGWMQIVPIPAAFLFYKFYMLPSALRTFPDVGK